MGTFTMTLMEVLDAGEKIWDESRPYPIFDPAYRDKLNEKIVDHYALREIGTETIGHFRFFLNRKMREIMPYYNQLYQSEKLITPDDVFTTVTMTTSGESEQNDSNTSHTTSANESTTDNVSRAVTSETPQTRLAGDEDYATGVTDVHGKTTVGGSGTGDATQTGQSTGNMTNTVKGSQGHTAVLLAQYRASFLNIDMMVISDLESLFMQITDNGDEFFTHRTGFTHGAPFGWYGGL